MMIRRRIRTAVVLFAVTACAVFGGLLHLADEWVEDAAVGDLLEAELNVLIELDALGSPTPIPGGNLLYFRTASGVPPPAQIASLPAGTSHFVEFQGESYWVARRNLASNDVAFLMFPAGFLQVRERQLRFVAIAAAVVFLLVTISLGFWFADRALEPLHRLIAGVRTLKPGARGEKLVSENQDSELAVLVDALNQYVQAAEDSIERERAFSSAASHELRGPLMVIHNNLELIRTTDLDHERPLQRAERSIAELTGMLDSLLALARPDVDVHSDRIDLAVWLIETARACLPNEQVQRLRWELGAQVVLSVPEGAAAIVFTNLLRNALRVSGRQAVQIELKADRVRISDHGPGIEPHLLPRVFEPGVGTSDGGSGMGLYISATIAARQGWKIELNNRESGGLDADWVFRV